MRNREWQIALHLCALKIYLSWSEWWLFLLASLTSLQFLFQFIIWWIAFTIHLSRFNVLIFVSLWQHFLWVSIFCLLSLLLRLLASLLFHGNSDTVKTEWLEHWTRWIYGGTVNWMVSDNKSSLPFHFHWIIIIIIPPEVYTRTAILWTIFTSFFFFLSLSLYYSCCTVFKPTCKTDSMQIYISFHFVSFIV